MMFDLPKFWLGTALYVLIIGVVIAVVGAAFNTFIGIPAKEYHQVVTHRAPIQGSKVVPVEITREKAPSVLPLPPSVHRTPTTNAAEAMTPPQTVVREIQIIVPEPKSTRRGAFRVGF
jgi:hypothetical protein